VGANQSVGKYSAIYRTCWDPLRWRPADIDAVKRGKFKPAMQDGKPVAVQMAVELSFRSYQGGAHQSGATRSLLEFA
jgi:hypothetical protein